MIPTPSRSLSSSACIESLESRRLLSASALRAAAPATPSTTTVLHVSGKPSVLFGQDIKTNVPVKAKHGKLTGAVEFLDNGAPVQALTLSSTGQMVQAPLIVALKGNHATYTFGPGDVALFPGQHMLTAEYVGNGTLPASTSNAVTVTVAQPTYTTAADGIGTATVKKGHGKTATAGATARVQYTGFLAGNGSIFDYATANRGAGSTPYFDFTLGAQQVIPGFDEGATGMKTGEERVVFIPAAQGYGVNGAGASIPPNSDLYFLLKLLSVK